MDASILAVIYRAIANIGTITTLYNKIAPLLPQLTQLINILQGKSTTVYDVKWLQNGLNKLGASPQLVVDGSYGEATRTAVKEYQKKKNLAVDGWAGVETTASLIHDLA